MKVLTTKKKDPYKNITFGNVKFLKKEKGISKKKNQIKLACQNVVLLIFLHVAMIFL